MATMITPSIPTSQFVVNVISQRLGVDPNSVVPSARIVDDLGGDAEDNHRELANAFADALNILITDQQAETLHTVQDCINLMTTILGK